MERRIRKFKVSSSAAPFAAAAAAPPSARLRLRKRERDSGSGSGASSQQQRGGGRRTKKRVRLGKGPWESKVSKASGAWDAPRKAAGGSTGVTRCIYFSSPGGCRNASCTFAHDSFCSADVPIEMPLCNFHLMGTCTSGVRCRYSHPRVCEHVDVPRFVYDDASFAARLWSLRRHHPDVDIRDAPVQPQERVDSTWTRPALARGPSIYSDMAKSSFDRDRYGSGGAKPDTRSLVISGDDRYRVVDAVGDLRGRFCLARDAAQLLPLSAEETEFQRRAERRELLKWPVTTFRIPSQYVGRLIGRNGDARSELERATGAAISIDGNGGGSVAGNGKTRVVTLAGPAGAVKLAEEQIKARLQELAASSEKNKTGRKGKRGKGKKLRQKRNRRRKEAAAAAARATAAGYADEEERGFGDHGFTRAEENDLLCQGVKPWDDDAGAVLSFLHGGYGEEY